MIELPLNTVIQGGVRGVLKTFPDESVHCVITSPPYFGLRDYGLEPLIWGGKEDCEHVWGSTLEPGGQGTGKSFRRDRKAGRKRGGHQPGFCQLCGAWCGNLGLEPTPELYVEHIVEICRELKRVLRSDGTFFLNMGDSYFSGSQRAISYDTSGKVLEDCRDHDCLCENLCDVCREVYRSHRFHNDSLLVSMLSASLSEPNQGNRVSRIDHFPTLDFSCLESRILTAIQDFGRFVLLEGEQLFAFQESMPDEFSRQLLGECWQRGSSSSCLLCGHSLSDCVRVSGGKKACTCGIEKPSDASNHHKSDTLSSGLAYPNLTTKSSKINLKPKDLCGMPWRVAFALQADGWWLRSDIIWSKPNPMPESVTDRPTRSHEYVFLLTKSSRYFYDAEAIKEPCSENSHERGDGINPKAQKAPSGWDTGSVRGNGKIGRYPRSKQNPSFSGSVNRLVEKRNKRSVWTIVTQPYPEAHFATFPEKLVKPMILAGTKEGDIVLDPFIGSGTVALVATKLERNYIGIDLKQEYIDMAKERVRKYNEQTRLL